MLEFIVLGEIPGTSVNITFAQVLIISALLLIVSEYRTLAHRKNLVKVAQDIFTRTSV